MGKKIARDTILVTNVFLEKVLHVFVNYDTQYEKGTADNIGTMNRDSFEDS